MKKIAHSLCCLAVALWSIDVAHAQENPDKQELKVKKRTLMEQFEPEMILTPEKRLELKQDRLTTLRRNKRILDTLSISERRRKALIRDLVQKPHSDRLNKTLAEVEYEEDLQE
ncbi:MAG: hypothetical protein AAFX53_01935 [Bacteroidota bacterium]